MLRRDCATRVRRTLGAQARLIVLVALGCVSPAARTKPPATDKATGAAACVVGAPEVCRNGIDDNCNSLVDEGCGESLSRVDIVAAWAERDVEVQLLVYDPAGRLVEAGVVSESGLEKVLDCPGAGPACRGGNRDRVALAGEGAPMTGTYGVVVRLEELGEAQLPIVVNVSAHLGVRAYAAVLDLPHEGATARVDWLL